MSAHEALIAEAQTFTAPVTGRVFDADSAEVTGLIDRLIAALDSATVERAVVEAQALEQAAEKIAEWRMNVGSSGNRAHDESWDNGNMSAESMLRARAVEIREGRQ